MNAQTPLVIHLILDGFASEYLAYAPFLSEKIGAGKGRPIRTVSPFGSRGMIFTGFSPGKSQLFTDLWRDPAASRYRTLPGWQRKPHPLPAAIRFIVRLATRVMSDYPCPLPPGIPASFLPRFDKPPLSRHISTFRGNGPVPSLIERLQKQHVPYQFFGPPTKGFWQKPFTQIIKKIKPESRYLCVHVITPDLTGHQYGPDSPEIRDLTARIDREIEQLCAGLNNLGREAVLLIHSDHGMSRVRTEINFWQEISKWPLTAGIDFDFFLDSTMARFWLLKPAKENVLQDCIASLAPAGHLLSEQDRQAAGLHGLDARYGDYLVTVEEGAVIMPNFFQTAPIRGMHGYIRSQSTGMVAWRNSFAEAIRRDISLLDITPTILKLLHLSPPKGIEGTAIF
ncbi:MAG: alkaline phosphatase family protein [Thermodesulfobacteriota bacterium]